MSHSPPIRDPRRRVGLHWWTCVAVWTLSAPAFAAEAPTHLDCAALDCASVLPGATRFESVDDAPFQRGVDAAGETVGWVALSTDVVDIKAYSGKPLVTLVGLDDEGVISGAKILHHSEPILLVGIPEQTLHDFVAFYAGKPAITRVIVGVSSAPDAVTIDAISGATVTALAQNRTVLDTAREIGTATGVVNAEAIRPGRFVASDTPMTWAEMVSAGVFGRLTVTQAEMGATGDGAFVDLWFTLADAPQVGRALLGDGDYQFLHRQLAPGEHLLVVFGAGSSSFKGSGFVRGGIFDRVRVEQGLKTLMFRDTDYTNLPSPKTPGAPAFHEGAVFVTRGGLDPGAPFDLIFLGSRYSGRGGFNREFNSFARSHQLPASIYAVEGGIDTTIWKQAWRNQRVGVAVLGAMLLLVFGLFVARRWLTASLVRVQRIHVAYMLTSFLVLGLWLRAQPSVAQVLTLTGAATGDWRWDLFLAEPLLFISWIFIAVVSLVWGRGVFCGWVCPYGAASELVHKVALKLGLRGRELPPGAHRWLRFVRYLVLACLVPAYLYSPELGERMVEIEPFKSTFFIAPWTRHWGFFAWWLVLAGLSVVVYRPFCRYLCPLGAALAIPGSLRRSGPRRRAFCESCRICTRGCEPLAIRPNGRIDPRECLSCMECEANYRADTVCPPLIGLAKLDLTELSAQSAKREKLMRDVADVPW